jgi:hypothetical protein
MSSVQPNTPHWREAIEELAAYDRPSASDGERRAAESIGERLRALGCRVTVESERAHGGYWWPLGLANGLAAAGAVLALRSRGLRARAIAALAGGAASAAIWDDVGGGRLWFRRALLRHRTTWNVVAETGDPAGARTVVVLAHHDAAHSGLVFHPALGRLGPRLAPRAHERSTKAPSIMYLVWGGPVMVLAGALTGLRRLIGLGVALATGTVLAMADIGHRSVVPGANDNLTAVAVLLALAESLRDEPLEGVRVLLVSTGSEESFMEGMQGFGRRHFPELDRGRTEVLCLECLGGPHLMVLEGEGMLRMRHYQSHMRESLADAATQAGVRIGRGLRTVAATDGLIALRAGYPTVTMASVADTKLPLNYHWPSDRPEELYWDTVMDAIAVSERFLRSRSRAANLPSG